jgi:hypothetical protein
MLLADTASRSIVARALMKGVDHRARSVSTHCLTTSFARWIQKF